MSDAAKELIGKPANYRPDLKGTICGLITGYAQSVVNYYNGLAIARELVQNADDAHSDWFEFYFTSEVLIVKNNSVFNKANFESIKSQPALAAPVARSLESPKTTRSKIANRAKPTSLSLWWVELLVGSWLLSFGPSVKRILLLLLLLLIAKSKPLCWSS